jgi:hypothetical protein
MNRISWSCNDYWAEASDHIDDSIARDLRYSKPAEKRTANSLIGGSAAAIRTWNRIQPQPLEGSSIRNKL